MRALDLFCGGGGAAIGLIQAGFSVVGVDNKLHKNYPGDFIQGDIHNLPVDPFGFDFVWASPPCQFASVGSYCRKGGAKDHPNLIPITREILKEHPYTVIENVPQADVYPSLILNGSTMGLPFIVRKRYFELSFWMWQPVLRPKFSDMTFTVAGSLSSTNKYDEEKRKKMGLPLHTPKEIGKAIMGIPYFQKMTVREICEAVPPPYAKYIGEQALIAIKKGETCNSTY